MRKFLGTLFIVIVVMFFGSCVYLIGSFKDTLPMARHKPTKPSILSLKLDSVIMDGQPFLTDLMEYAEEDIIKGVLIQVNSPGGVVGPSQEIYSEIKRVRDTLKKPVVVSVLGLAASGAYYASLGANKIITNPGSLLGSIGVIMEFANLEKLYEWAKIQRYVIKTGNYKDSGAEYRPMREDERQVFQAMANEVLDQFKKAIVEGRKLSPELVDQNADGRVFTGEKAVAMGFADQVGTLADAKKMVGQLAGLGEKAEFFEPPSKSPSSLLDLISDVSSKTAPIESIKNLIHLELWGQPLLLLPTALPVKSSK